MEHETHVTRAWVLRPEVKSADSKRDASFALEEAVSLADALPDLEVIGADGDYRLVERAYVLENPRAGGRYPSISVRAAPNTASNISGVSRPVLVL